MFVDYSQISNLKLRPADCPLIFLPTDRRFMKTKIAAISFAIVTMLATACEQHKWSETQKLFKEGEHGEKAAAEQGNAEATGEKKAEEAKH